jgi:hypothetical protein
MLVALICASPAFIQSAVAMPSGSDVVSAASLQHTAKSLRAQFVPLNKQLADNVFGLPIVLDSRETSTSLSGDVHARVDFPYAAVFAAMSKPESWCEVLVLHPNTKYCAVSGRGAKTTLTVNLGSKHEQALKDTHRVVFSYQSVSSPPDYSGQSCRQITGRWVRLITG